MPEKPFTPQTVAERCAALSSQGLEFVVAATAADLEEFDLGPFDVAVRPLPLFHREAADWTVDDFVEMFYVMDTLVFEHRGLTMPRWVVVDHALMSSGLSVIACRAELFDELAVRHGLDSDERATLQKLKSRADEMGYVGPVPIASYCAAPTGRAGHRVGWSLCSIVPRVGLGSIVKALGLGITRTRSLTGTTQYDNHALRVHTQFGGARVVAAKVELHTAPYTLVYETNVDDWIAGASATNPGAPPTGTIMRVSPTDTKRHDALQALIDDGRAVTVLPPGLQMEGDETWLDIHVADDSNERGRHGV